MKKLTEYISLIVFIASLCWFTSACYNKYSLDQLMRNIRMDNQQDIEELSNFLDHCIILEAMRYQNYKFDIGYQSIRDSIGVLWYDEYLAQQENLKTKITMINAKYHGGCFSSYRFHFIKDAVTSDVIFTPKTFFYESGPCQNTTLNINGKLFNLKFPHTYTIAKADTCNITATFFHYNSKLNQIDSTLIAARTLQLN